MSSDATRVDEAIPVGKVVPPGIAGSDTQGS